MHHSAYESLVDMVSNLTKEVTHLKEDNSAEAGIKKSTSGY
jgi:hypothetical protein